MDGNNTNQPSRQPRLLVRNVSYPTYQLHASAVGNGVSPQDALKIALLEAMRWLRQRFRAHELPEELDLPEPSRYAELEPARLHSFLIDMGYRLEVLWLPEQQLWAMQLTEPDLGAHSGENERFRLPVPGRSFETSVSFQARQGDVDCGVKIVVYEPEGLEADCEVFRPALEVSGARSSADAAPAAPAA